MADLRSALDPRDNAINLLRLVFATSVIVSHAWPLGGFGADPHTPAASLGDLAVAGFFLLSGWLITRSSQRQSVPRYLWHRALRIMPGFWVSLLVVAFGFAAVAYHREHGRLTHFLSTGPVTPPHYVIDNAALVMRHYDVADTLQGAPLDRGWNGSLHTLFQEACCYLLIAFLVATGLLRRRWSLPATAIALWALLQVYVYAKPTHHLPIVDNIENTGYVLAFVIGSLTFSYADRIPLRDDLAAAAVVGTGLSLLSFHVFLAAGFLCFAYLVFWAAVRVPGHRVGRRNDISYGIYIYAFPVQKMLTLYGLNRHGVVLYVLLGVVLTLPLAVLSWVAVERPALKLKDAALPAVSPSRAGGRG